MVLVNLGGCGGGDFGERGATRCQKTPGNAETREGAKIPSVRLLPWVPVCFRVRVVAAVSLVSELYPVYGIGKFGGVVGFGKRGTKRREKEPVNLETRAGSNISRFRPLPWASVCFRGRVAAVVSLASELYPL